MNKKLLMLLIVAMVVILPAVSACGRTAPTGGVLPQPVPHAIDVRFSDCNVCHVLDQLTATPIPHTGEGFEYTNADCTQPGCHEAPSSTAPPPSSTTMPPTTTTTSGTPTGTETTTPPTSETTTAGPPPTIGDVAIAITTHSAVVMKAYTGLCQTCHGPGLSNSNPYPPTWDATASGSTHESGVFTVVPGSPADHSQYTVDQCTQEGCHAVPAA